MEMALNKTSLKQQRDHLAMYERFLPSLDLKRRQLLLDQQRARRESSAIEQELQATLDEQQGLLALLGASSQDLTGLVAVKSVEIGEENRLGVKLPVLQEVTFQITPYSMLAKPFWVDFLVELLQVACRLRLQQRVARERVQKLEEAVRRITQRVNLFEKVLIPEAKRNIQRIQIYLADAERAAVVRSKLAKAKQHQRHLPGKAS